MEQVKKGIRVLGVDDGAFSFDDGETFLTGVVYRGTEFIEDIVVTPVTVDGYDATGKIVELFENCRNTTQLKAVLLDGISFAGFNLVDLEEVGERTGRPVVAVTSNEPDREDFRRTMERTGNVDGKFDEMDDPETLVLDDGEVYVQYAGASLDEVEGYIRNSVIHGLTPEPIRVAHMIGRAFHDSMV